MICLCLYYVFVGYSYIHVLNLLTTFPYDNLLVQLGVLFLSKYLLLPKLPSNKDIEENIKDVILEIENLKST